MADVRGYRCDGRFRAKELLGLTGLAGLMVASATAEQGVVGSIPRSKKVLLGFSITDFSLSVTESGFVGYGTVDSNRLPPYYNITGEMWVYY